MEVVGRKKLTREEIVKILENYDWIQGIAAEMLGVSQATMSRMCQRLEIIPPSGRWRTTSFDEKIEEPDEIKIDVGEKERFKMHVEILGDQGK